MNTEYIAKPTFIEKLAIISLVLLQILSTYGTVSYRNYGILFAYLVSLIVYFKAMSGGCSLNKAMPPKLTRYFVYWIIIHLLSNLSGGYLLPQNILLIIFYYWAFWAVIRQENLPILIKYYKIVAWICIIFFFVQEASVLTTGTRISGIFSFLPYALHAHEYDEFMYRLMASTRSASFFSEPSYFAQYIVPLFAIYLFEEEKEGKYKWSIVSGLTILLTQSGTGIMAAVAVIVFFVKEKINLQSARNMLSSVVIVVSLVVGGFMFSKTEMGQGMLERKSELSLENEGGSRSGYMRMFRGLMLFSEYSFPEMVFGNDNDNDIIRLTQTSAISNDFGDNQDTFFNGVQYCLLRTGIIGLLLLFSVFIDIWKGNSSTGKAIILAFIVLMFLEAVFFANNMLLYLLLANNHKNQDNQLSI